MGSIGNWCRMADLTCAGVREISGEFALGILPHNERAGVAAHLLRCRECRQETTTMTAIGMRLMELIPGTEPPLGFDRRVLARFRPQRRPFLAAIAVAAVAAAIAAAGASGDLGGHPARAADLASPLRQGARTVGMVSVGGRPAWVTMTIRAGTTSGPVTCELLARNGVVTKLGAFDLVDGSGSWGAPDPASMSGVVGARLVNPAGRVIATATFA